LRPTSQKTTRIYSHPTKIGRTFRLRTFRVHPLCTQQRNVELSTPIPWKSHPPSPCQHRRFQDKKATTTTTFTHQSSLTYYFSIYYARKTWISLCNISLYLLPQLLLLWWNAFFWSTIELLSSDYLSSLKKRSEKKPPKSKSKLYYSTYSIKKATPGLWTRKNLLPLVCKVWEITWKSRRCRSLVCFTFEIFAILLLGIVPCQKINV